MIKEPLVLGPDTMAPSVLSAWRYHRWIFDQFRPWVKGRVLEIGSGHGIYTKFLMEQATSVLATDLDPRSLALIRKRLSDPKLSVAKLDILDRPAIDNLAGPFDLVVCLNLLEHLEQDKEAVRNMASVLSQNGYLIIYTPAFQRLFSPLDRFAGHFRRYNRSSLRQVLEEANLEIASLRYMNALGILGWVFFGKLMKPSHIDEPAVDHAIRLFDRRLILLAKIVDRLIFNLFGLSVLAVARKSPDQPARK